MKTSFSGSRSAWAPNQAPPAPQHVRPLLLAGVSGFFKCDPPSIEEAPHGALRHPQPVLALQMSGDLRQRHIRGLLDQRQNLLAVRLDPMRAVVAALRSRLISARPVPRLDPLDRCRDADPKPLRCRPSRHPTIHRHHHPATQVIRKRLRHARWSPSPACTLNQISNPLGIPLRLHQFGNCSSMDLVNRQVTTNGRWLKKDSRCHAISSVSIRHKRLTRKVICNPLVNLKKRIAGQM